MTQPTHVQFPLYTGARCLMMPYIQGDPTSVPASFQAYAPILASVFVERGALGFLTVDESAAQAGTPHRGAHAKHGRALHTEAGLVRDAYVWGPPVPSWGGGRRVTLDRDVRVMIASSVAGTCAVWDAEHADTSEDGDIGDQAERYSYAAARVLGAGEIASIGILTPHESLPVAHTCRRQFLRIVGSGVHGREDYFTRNPVLEGRA